jgi:hypothetical protein
MEDHRLGFELPCRAYAFAQYLLGMGMAFAAARAEAEVFANLRHAGHARIDCLADSSIRDVVADTDDHAKTLLSC